MFEPKSSSSTVVPPRILLQEFRQGQSVTEDKADSTHL